MDISLQSLLFFTIITILYFVFPSIGKPILILNDLEDNQSKSNYYIRNIKSLLFYLGIVIISQFFLNIGYLIAKCGGSINKNISSAALYTFIPWVFIFGIMIGVLIVFPGFKTAFSNVIGYFVIAGSANELLSTMLMGTDLNNLIEQTTDPGKKKELSYTAEAILKICGNKSILVNQINPDNFLQIWDVLKPLMKEGIYNNLEYKKDLLHLVNIKENIGEACWYIYSAILVSSIVYYNLATKGCVKDINQMKKEHDNYLQKQETNEQKQALNNSTSYVLG
jgi:hypothetical protein